MIFIVFISFLKEEVNRTENNEIKIGKTFDSRETSIQFRDHFCQINKFRTVIQSILAVKLKIYVSKYGNTRIRSYYLVLTLSFFFTKIRPKIDKEHYTYIF